MDLSWIALLLLTFFWFSAVPVYEPGSFFAPVCLLAALICAWISYWRGNLPGGGNGSHRNQIQAGAGFANGFILCVYIFFAQGAVFPFLYWLFAKFHQEGFLAIISGYILNLLGLQTIVEKGAIHIASAVGTVVITSAWEKFAAFHFLLLLVGGIVILILKKARLKHYLVFILVTSLYAVIRYSFLLAVYAHYRLHSIFWEQTAAFLLLLPYVLILAVLFKKLNEQTVSLAGFPGWSFVRDRKTRLLDAITIFAVVILVLSGTAFFAWQEVGREKQGRVLVDEYHSDWEWTDEAYDEYWFGERSGYNYYCFYEHINRYYHASRNTSPITSQTLTETDILILKTPTSPYSNAEISAVLEFVHRGGSVFLIGDHTNVFGTSSYLNQIAVPMGLRFRYDCTYELTRGNLQEYTSPRLLPHPVVKGMPLFLFATSCTLEANWRAEEIILGSGLKNLPLDYSRKNFFPADPNAPLMEFGVFLQCAGITYGKGRVLAFTDSTVFSNFWMFMTGKPELLLKSMQWLNRENSSIVSNRAIAVAGIGFALCLLIGVTWRYKQQGWVFPVGICLVAALTVFGMSYMYFSARAELLQTPEARLSYTKICFESEYTNGKLPNDLSGFFAKADEQISTFYVWTQRLGCVPSLEESLSMAVEKGDIAVTIKPGRAIGNTEDLIKQIGAGKTLLILDNGEQGDYSGDLLRAAGMKIRQTSMSDTASAFQLFGEQYQIPLTPAAATVDGGMPLIFDENGKVVFSVQRIGSGKIAVFTDPDLFYNANLGDVSANLTEKTSLLTRLEFQIFKHLLQ
ncbi:MAG: GldG family protein [Peptococcaceae bacterium]|nr:GldG family protein [Peptococcaceae bacterium]